MFCVRFSGILKTNMQRLYAKAFLCRENYGKRKVQLLWKGIAFNER